MSNVRDGGSRDGETARVSKEEPASEGRRVGISERLELEGGDRDDDRVDK